MSVLRHARFYMGVADSAQLPPDEGREIAFAGRSNAGKSSAINALTGRRKLAFVSRTPGRTQQINYYALGEGRYLVDLPGYGFARVPAEVRARWDRLLSAYLRERRALRGLIVIMDARHPLTPLDRQLLDWFAPTGKPVLLLLAKADKLSRRQAAAQLESVRGRAQGHEVVLFSSVSREGVEAARRFVDALLETAGAEGSHLGGDSGKLGAHEKKNPRLKGIKPGVKPQLD
jgi:GTP-binding protein